MKFILFIITFFLNISFILAETFYLNMYFKFDDREVLSLSDNEKYTQFKASANWEDSKGDYGIISCLGSFISSKITGTNFQAYCIAENQENDKFWLHFVRKSDDMDVGIGESKYINGTGKYKELIGISCPYAVKFYKDRTFFKKKCNTSN